MTEPFEMGVIIGNAASSAHALARRGMAKVRLEGTDIIRRMMLNILARDLTQEEAELWIEAFDLNYEHFWKKYQKGD